VKTSYSFLIAFVVIIAGWGCGGGDTDISKVEGVVTMDGNPLPKATVLFISGQGRPAGAITDENGRYELNYTAGRKGAIPGKNRVQITTAQGPSETADGQPIPGVRETIPLQYNVESILEFTVEEGKVNVANFDLESKGKVSSEEP